MDYSDMAEWSTQQWQIFSQHFLPKYNKLNNTSFGLQNNKTKTTNSDFDFIEKKTGKVLSLQHTKAVGTEKDTDMEIVRPKHSEYLIKKIKEELEIRKIDRYMISVNFSNPPKTNSEAVKAAYWISELIQMMCTKDSREIYSFNQETHDFYVKPCTKWISQIDITPSDTLHFSWGWSTHPLKVEGVLDADCRFLNALRKKEGLKYHNASELILLIDFSPFPFDKNDLSKFIEIAKKEKPTFKEIWVYQLWSGARGAYKAY